MANQWDLGGQVAYLGAGCAKEHAPDTARGFRESMERRIKQIEADLARVGILQAELERLKKMVAADLEGRDR